MMIEMGHCHDGGTHNSGCEQKTWPLDVESSFEYTECGRSTW